MTWGPLVVLVAQVIGDKGGVTSRLENSNQIGRALKRWSLLDSRKIDASYSFGLSSIDHMSRSKEAESAVKRSGPNSQGFELGNRISTAPGSRSKAPTRLQ